MALARQEQLRTLHKPNRTERRHLQRVAKAKQNGSDELLALIPDFQGRGNRQPRLSEAQEDAIEQVIRDEYRSEEHTSELQSLMRISYAVFCLKKKKPRKY